MHSRPKPNHLVFAPSLQGRTRVEGNRRDKSDVSHVANGHLFFIVHIAGTLFRTGLPSMREPALIKEPA